MTHYMNPIQMHTLALVAVLISITSSRAADNAVTNLPAGWTAMDLGTVRKPGAVSYDAATKAFTIRTIGEVTEQRGTFAFTRVKGDFVATCRVTAASQKSVGVGLMVRTSTNSEARFLKNAFNGFRFGNGPAMTARQTDGVAAWQPGDIAHGQLSGIADGGTLERLQTGRLNDVAGSDGGRAGIRARAPRCHRGGQYPGQCVYVGTAGATAQIEEPGTEVTRGETVRGARWQSRERLRRGQGSV